MGDHKTRANTGLGSLGKLSQVYLSTIYHRIYEAEMEREVVEEPKRPTEQAGAGRLEGVWMIQLVDKTLRHHVQSQLPQIGSLAMKGDVQMISLK